MHYQINFQQLKKHIMHKLNILNKNVKAKLKLLEKDMNQEKLQLVILL